MRRRRLVGAVGVLTLIVAGAAWWLSADRLTAEEQRLIGTWVVSGPSGVTMEVYTADRVCRWRIVNGRETPDLLPYRWAVKDVCVEYDEELSALRRLLRPLAPRLGIKVGERHRIPLVSVSDDTLTMHRIELPHPTDKLVVFTRAPADWPP